MVSLNDLLENLLLLAPALAAALVVWERLRLRRVFNRLDDMLDAVGIDPCKLCTYCWNGKE